MFERAKTESGFGRLPRADRGDCDALSLTNQVLLSNRFLPADIHSARGGIRSRLSYCKKFYYLRTNVS